MLSHFWSYEPMPDALKEMYTRQWFLFSEALLQESGAAYRMSSSLTKFPSVACHRKDSAYE